MLKSLPDKVDLQQPLLTLSDLLRKGGNMSTHFSPSYEPDKETTEAMLDLVEYLLEYLYTLPGMIMEFRA